jgi:hypothetical protein
MRKGKRNDVNYMEFRDGYVLVERAELEAVIEGYKNRELKRAELRVYAAMCEQKGLHRRSKVDIARILNCKSDKKGIRRLSSSDIERARANIRPILDSAHQSDSEPRIAVSRRMLRHAARGGSTSNEIIVMLFYCMKRLRQCRRLDRLKEDERYARFRYRELESESGIPRANVCRAVRRLRAKGILNTAWVKKQNENRFGLLFVDGSLVSLSCPRQRANRCERPRLVPNITTTPLSRIDNAPQHETTTLRNDNPKTNYQRSSTGVFDQNSDMRVRRLSDFERIKQRAEQMKAEWIEQAA